MSYCPECEAVIENEVEEVGEVISCPECGVDLEVISLDPVEFDLAPVDDEEDDDLLYDDSDVAEDDWDEDDDSREEDDEEADKENY